MSAYLFVIVIGLFVLNCLGFGWIFFDEIDWIAFSGIRPAFRL